MRKILCEEHGAMKPTPPEDAAQGLYERRFRGILDVNVVCDVCNKDLLKGSQAVAVTLPQDMPEWESNYFHALSADFWNPDFNPPEVITKAANAFLVRELGERIGYGNMMHLTRDEWRTSLLKADHAGGEFAVGCCVALTALCGCTYPCDWCNGCGWVTPKVAALRDTLKRLENAFLMVYDLAGIDATPSPEALPESAYVPGYMDKVRELREVFALVTADVAEREAETQT